MNMLIDSIILFGVEVRIKSVFYFSLFRLDSQVVYVAILANYPRMVREHLYTEQKLQVIHFMYLQGISKRVQARLNSTLIFI